MEYTTACAAATMDSAPPAPSGASAPAGRKRRAPATRHMPVPARVRAVLADDAAPAEEVAAANEIAAMSTGKERDRVLRWLETRAARARHAEPQPWNAVVRTASRKRRPVESPPPAGAPEGHPSGASSATHAAPASPRHLGVEGAATPETAETPPSCSSAGPLPPSPPAPSCSTTCGGKCGADPPPLLHVPGTVADPDDAMSARIAELRAEVAVAQLRAPLQPDAFAPLLVGTDGTWDEWCSTICAVPASERLAAAGADSFTMPQFCRACAGGAAVPAKWRTKIRTWAREDIGLIVHGSGANSLLLAHRREVLCERCTRAGIDGRVAAQYLALALWQDRRSPQVWTLRYCIDFVNTYAVVPAGHSCAQRQRRRAIAESLFSLL